MSERGLFGLTGSFASPDALTEAARQLRSLGFRAVEAYTPYPVEGLEEVLRPGRRDVAAASDIFWCHIRRGLGLFHPVLG